MKDASMEVVLLSGVNKFRILVPFRMFQAKKPSILAFKVSFRVACTR